MTITVQVVFFVLRVKKVPDPSSMNSTTLNQKLDFALEQKKFYANYTSTIIKNAYWALTNI
ncbi:hypothetical protein BpHYR1_019829 [Brachionus plicatilis]|uniref:Uncharacterized protein n=1 Tax=Brachionus plicatilis TaxID=10195 RepID=A0A3M7PHJ4_BRAPC|nr:hypothetical protein BpHYR1_019829 [Brachionus plicatilis]